jgi:hypothetical protein
MPDATLAFRQPLSTSQIADLRLGASKMSGPKRRAFEAEMTLKYCQGDPLQAETMFGWDRHTVEVGLAERRTGIICLGAQSAFSGRHRWEDKHPEVAAALRRLAEAHAHQDPTFRTTLAYTRLTAKAALAALRAQGYCQAQLPAPSTMAVVLNGWVFGCVKSSKPNHKKSLRRPMPFLPTLQKRPRSHDRGPRQTLEYRL